MAHTVDLDRDGHMLTGFETRKCPFGLSSKSLHPSPVDFYRVSATMRLGPSNRGQFVQQITTGEYGTTHTAEQAVAEKLAQQSVQRSLSSNATPEADAADSLFRWSAITSPLMA